MARPLSFVVREEDVERIGELRYEHPHPRVQQRCWVLWFVSRKLTLIQACELAGVSRTTGWRYSEAYREKGLDGLLAMNWEGPESGLTPYRETLEASFREQPPHTVNEAVERIEQLTGVRRGPTQVHQFLREALGLSWQRTAAVPCPPKKTSPSTLRSRPTF
jgi:transposase